TGCPPVAQSTATPRDAAASRSSSSPTSTLAVGDEGATARRGDVTAATLLALAARLVWLRYPTGMEGDGAEYLRIAGWLVRRSMFSEDGTTPSSYRPPVYPWLLAGFSAVSSDPVTLTLVAQCLLGALTVALTYWTAVRLFNRRTAMVACLALALAPMTTRYAAA